MTIVPGKNYQINELMPEARKISIDDRLQHTEVSTRILAAIIATPAGSTLQFSALELVEFDPFAVDITAIDDRQLFAAVDRFNEWVGASVDVPERTAKLLSQLNAIACQQASTKHAYLLALKYARSGLKLLGSAGWQQEDDNVVTLYELAIAAAARCGEFELMDDWIDRVSKHIAAPLALVEICIIKIQSLIDRDRPQAAMQLGSLMLAQLGVQLPAAPTTSDVDRAIQEIDDLILNVSPVLTTMSAPHLLAIVSVAARMMGACYAIDPQLYALLVALQVKLSIQHGSSASSAYSFAAYAILLHHYPQQVKTADRFKCLAYELAIAVTTQTEQRSIATRRQQQIYQWQSRTFAAIGLFLTHRTAHLREAMPILQAGYRAGLATARFTDASYNLEGLVAAAFWCGENLSQQAAHLLADRAIDTGSALEPPQPTSDRCEIYHQTIQLLLGTSVDLDPIINENLQLAGKDLEWRFAFYLHRAMLGLLMGDLSQATAATLKAREYLSAVVGSIDEVNYYFYDSQIALAAGNESLARVRTNQQQLRHWAKSAPMNYLHKWQLVEAEICRVSGDKAGAIEFYDLAIAGAIANDYLQEAALANELAAKFYLTWGKAKIAAEYLQSAYRYYTQWGAIAKLHNLASSYPQLVLEVSSPTPLPLMNVGAVADNGINSGELRQLALSNSKDCANRTSFEFDTYLRSIEALYSEIDLDRLLRKLMDVVVEHAGADKAALLLSQNGNLTIALEYDNGELETLDFDLHSYDRDYRLPLFLIRQVHDTKNIAIYQGNNHPYLAKDPYFDEYQPHSILCVPILNQSRTIGILYLENSTTTEAFTADRVDLLNIICTQAAISIENARLHQESQAYAQQLEQSLLDLQSSKARLQTVADRIPGVITQVCIDPDRDGEVLRYISSGCYELYGVTAEEMLAQGYSFRSFEHPEDRPEIDRAIARSQQQLTPIRVEFRIVTASGRVKWIYLNASSPEPQADGSFLVECAILDISERQVAIQERKQALIELQATNEELSRSNRLKDQFLANMSHELRTPLNAILGMTEGLKEQVFGSIDSAQAGALDTIASSGAHLLSLINDVLDLAKIEAGQLEIHCQPTAIVPLCEASLAVIRHQAVCKQIQVSVKFQSNLPDLFIDERRIRRVAIDLLNNAVKFTPPGGQIDLSVVYLDTPDFNNSTEVADSEPPTPQLEPRVRITISDTGIGISPDNLKRLFQPFVQIDGALNRQFEGTGLGLALVKRIVDLHGGRVGATSELGLGSSFTVDLPCDRLVGHSIDLDRDSSQIQPPITSIAISLDLVPLILLVEDNPANVHTMSSYLRAKGFRVISADNCRQAIDLAAAKPLDVILMDIRLPIVDSLTAIAHIREFSDVPIIALTALATTSDPLDETPGDGDRCLAAGANEYVSKPVKLKQLTTTIQQLLTAKE